MPYEIKKVFNKNIFTKVGSPTVTEDGIASGFGSGNTVSSVFPSVTPTQSFVMRTKGIWSSTPNTANAAKVFGELVGANSYPAIDIIDRPTYTSIKAVRFDSNVTHDSAVINLPRLLQNGDVVETEVMATSTFVALTAIINGQSYSKTWYGNGLYCGAIGTWRTTGVANYYWTGSIDLKACQLIVDGKVIVNGTKEEEVYVTPDFTTYLSNIEDYYANLLILQYRNKPKARSTIKALTDVCSGDGLVFELSECLNIDSAVGKQLDLIGQILGCNRNVYGLNPNMKYFSFEKTNAYGYSDKDALSEGYWKSYYNSTGSAYALTDSEYRPLLKFKAALNVMDGSMQGMDNVIYSIFGDNVQIINNQDLSITYYIEQQTVVTQAAQVLGYFKAPIGVAVDFSYGSST